MTSLQIITISIASLVLVNYNAANGQQDVDAGELLSVVVLYRHGDRAPIGSYPNDPYHDIKYWPEGLGQLLNAGKLRHYKLGKFFRNRYSSFLPKKYPYKEIYVLSSDVDRTLMSASSNLAGMLIPSGVDIWNEQLPWQPIPIHTLPQDEDTIVSMSKHCPRRDKLLTEVSNSEEFAGLVLKYTDFFQAVSNYTTWNITDIDTFRGLYTVLYIYSMHNRTYLPSWYYSIDQEILAYLAGLSFTKETYTEELRRLKAGPLFNYILQHFDKLLQNGQPKFLMISGHDGTLAAALNCMGVFDNHTPEFTSTVIWELRKKRGSNYINLYYKRNSTEDAQPLVIHGCSFDCDYNDFKNNLKRIAINDEDWEKECFAK